MRILILLIVLGCFVSVINNDGRMTVCTICCEGNVCTTVCVH